MSVREPSFTTLLGKDAEYMHMTPAEMYELLYEHQLWRIGESNDAMQEPKKVSFALAVVLHMLHAELVKHGVAT